MRSFDYARAPPEAGQGLVVFTVRLVLIVMGPQLMGDHGHRQRIFGKNRQLAPENPESASTRLNQPALSRNKRRYEPSQSF
jgi:hypothetical protein